MDPVAMITRRFSWGLMARLHVLVFLGAAVSASALYLNVHEPIENDYLRALLSVKGLQDELLLKALVINTVVGVVVLMAVALVTLFYSHRVAGPLFRLGREAGRVAEGDLTVDVKLRKTDVGVPLAEELTAFATHYRERVERLDEKTEELSNLTRSALDLMKGRKDAGSIEGSVGAVKEKLKEIEDAFKEIRL